MITAILLLPRSLRGALLFGDCSSRHTDRGQDPVGWTRTPSSIDPRLARSSADEQGSVVDYRRRFCPACARIELGTP
jgi:hypothetical protein